MIDVKKMGSHIARLRRETGFTQQQIADRLRISYQAVSKWEKGLSSPSLDILVSLSRIFGCSVDSMIQGEDVTGSGYSYAEAGVDITYTDRLKETIAQYVDTTAPHLIGNMRQFAALYDLENEKLTDPVLVLKAEEPGSKQILAMKYGYAESICHDMVNHLVNDIAVMGAKPLAVLDTIICGSAEKDTIQSIIRGVSDACRENECVLAGGETSIQPGVVDKGTYILTSSVVGLVDKTRIIDGSQMAAGDAVLAVASNGLHTNGYSLVRMLMEDFPDIVHVEVDGESFIEAAMKPHSPYYRAIKGIYSDQGVKAMAHITGGGLEGNVSRVIPEGLCAHIHLDDIHPSSLFRLIRETGNISDNEMRRTFNCGVGLVVVVEPSFETLVRDHISNHYECHRIGTIRTGDRKVLFHNALSW